MTIGLDTAELAFDSVLGEERARLVALCARLSGSATAAEDLAQEVMIEAWRHHGRLRDPARRRQWISGIARNVCLRWLRGEYRRLRPGQPGAIVRLDDELAESTPDELDISLVLERDELAELLDRAMALLPNESRLLLIQHYIEERPQNEIAALLGLSQGAVAMRLQRGKLALRRVLDNELRDDAVAYGLASAGDEVGWQATRLWCPMCGDHRLIALLDGVRGELSLRCPACSPDAGTCVSFSQLPSLLTGAKTVKPAVMRARQWSDQFYGEAIARGEVTCETCGKQAKVGRGLPEDAAAGWIGRDDRYGVHVRCPSCSLCCTSARALVHTLPEGRRFWSEQQRARSLPERDVTVDGQPAVLVRCESLTSAAVLDVLLDRATLRTLRVEEGAGR